MVSLLKDSIGDGIAGENCARSPDGSLDSVLLTYVRKVRRITMQSKITDKYQTTIRVCVIFVGKINRLLEQ